MDEKDHDRLIRHDGDLLRLRADLDEHIEHWTNENWRRDRQREKDMKTIEAVTRFQKTFIAASGGLGIGIGMFADAIKKKWGM